MQGGFLGSTVTIFITTGSGPTTEEYSLMYCVCVCVCLVWIDIYIFAWMSEFEFVKKIVNMCDCV